MSRTKLHVLLALCLSIPSAGAFGQAARSPFSSFGLGEQFGNALTANQGMGGVGVANPQYWSVNNQNPALLIYNRLTSYQAGLIGEQRTQSTSDKTEKSGSGNLNYLLLSIPIKPGKWTSSINLMPYTRLNYSFQYTQPITGNPDNTMTVTEQGSGGVNQVSWSNGVAIGKNLSVGLRAAYLFSSVSSEYSNVLTNTDQVYLISPNVYERTFVSDFQFTPGISIHFDSLFRDNYRLNIGAVYEIKTNLNSQFYQRIERKNAAGIIDSTVLINNQPGQITVPSILTAGVSFGKGYKWAAALEGTFANYSVYKDLSGKNPYSGNGWRVAAGFELTPDPVSLSNYLKRVTYRTGVSLENTPYFVNGNPVKDFGITFGFSLPVSRISSLDLALKVGKKGDKTLNTVEENYLKLYFGITFNDQWFIKRKFD